MRFERTTVRLATGLLPVLLALTACGAKGSSTGTGADATTTAKAPTTKAESTTSPAPTSGPSTTAAGPAGGLARVRARARAARANIRQADLPRTWTRSPVPAAGNTFDVCRPALMVEAHTVAKSRSDRFDLSRGTGRLSVQSTTGVLDDAALATRVLGALRDPTFITCVSKRLTGGSTVTAVGALALASGAARFGHDSVTLQGDFALRDQASGRSGTLRTAMVAIRTGSVVTTLSTSAVDLPADGALLQQLAVKVAARQKP
ncbi:MAG: hypothetical protein JWM05_2733 [Acidimicrobiales bacterium]|nr:hypothetical protein [Acidimicrobiales bacterium]